MHVDVVAAGAFVQVVAVAATIQGHCAALRCVKGDAVNYAAVRKVVSCVIEINEVAASVIVEVTVAIHKTIASLARHGVIGAALVGFRTGVGVADVEASDVVPV